MSIWGRLAGAAAGLAESGVQGLLGAIERFARSEFDDQAIRDNARRFSRERFRDEMASVIDRAARV